MAPHPYMAAANPIPIAAQPHVAGRRSNPDDLHLWWRRRNGDIATAVIPWRRRHHAATDHGARQDYKSRCSLPAT
jgi:hypothetical protein